MGRRSISIAAGRVPAAAQGRGTASGASPVDGIPSWGASAGRAGTRRVRDRRVRVRPRADGRVSGEGRPVPERDVRKAGRGAAADWPDVEGAAFDAARRAVAARLRGAVPDPMADARHLVAAAAGVPRDRLILLGPEALPAGAAARLGALVEGRLGGASVAVLTGRKAFWGRDFLVTKDVLAPRPETEGIVAEALREPFEAALDLGTGSGCLAVTLLAERPAARGVATDLSAAALAVARRNAGTHGVAPRLRLAQGDWWGRSKGGSTSWCRTRPIWPRARSPPSLPRSPPNPGWR